MLIVAVMCLGLVGCAFAPTRTGTTPTVEKFDPDKAAKTAKRAGYAAVMVWIIVEKPEDAQVAAVKPVLEEVTANVRLLVKDGFKSLLPELKKAVDKLIPGDLPNQKAERLLAYKALEITLDELDKQFSKHPEWKVKEEVVANVAEALFDGAVEAIDDYLDS
jgi:hypothetical protein